MPATSERQRRAMEAAAHGHSTLGIPKKVGEEFIGKDLAPGAKIAAAGIMFATSDGAVLFLKRGAASDHAGEWCFPGGCVEDGETSEDAARREAVEEIGGEHQGKLHRIARETSDDGVDFTTFRQDAPRLFRPTLSDEHAGWVWRLPDDLPSPLHPGVQVALRAAAQEQAVDADLGKLTEKERAEADRGHASREEMPAGAFLEAGARKYPVKEKTGGGWIYSRRLLLAAARDARMHGHESLAAQADVIRKRSFGDAADEAFALDKASVRSTDGDGHLHVAESNISKASVNPYYGREIPNFEKLGLDPDKIYNLLRDPDELEKGAASFHGKPLLIRHRPVTAADHDSDIVVGAISNPVFDHPFLKAELVIWPGPAIDAVESGEKQELSSGYRYDADMTPGRYEGTSYDGVMRNISGNHVSLVKDGRAGPEVFVGDAAIQTKENIDMATMPVVLTRKAAVAHGALIAYLRPKLAQDAKIDLVPALAKITAKNFGDSKASIIASVKSSIKGKLAQDADIEDVTKLLDALEDLKVEEGLDIDPNSGLPMAKKPDDKTMDAGSEAIKAFLAGKLSDEDIARVCAMIDDGKDEARGEAADESEEEKKKRMEDEKRAKDGKTAKDARGAKDEPLDSKGKPELKDMVTRPAMDAAIAAAVKAANETAVKTQREIRDAERAVRPYVGDLAMAHDSADAVYRTALTTLGVKIDGVHPSALRAILAAQPVPGATVKKPAVAMDAAAADGFAKRFPDAARINLM